MWICNRGKLTSKHAILNSWGTLLITGNRKAMCLSLNIIKASPRLYIISVDGYHTLIHTLNGQGIIWENFKTVRMQCPTYIDHASSRWCLISSILQNIRIHAMKNIQKLVIYESFLHALHVSSSETWCVSEAD